MQKNSYVYLIFLFILCVPCAADDFYYDSIFDDYSETFESSEHLDQIKQEIMALMQENEDLTYEYNSLKKKYEQLWQAVKKRVYVLGLNDDYIDQLQTKLGPRKTETDSIERDLNELENTLFKEKFKGDFLQNQVRLTEKNKKTLADQLIRLKKQKRSIEQQLDQKKTEFSLMTRKQEEELDNLRVQIEFTTEEEKSLARKMFEMEKDFLLFPKKVQLLKSNNSDISTLVDQLKRQKDFKAKENIFLKKKMDFLVKSKEDMMAHKSREKANLEQLVDELDLKYQTLAKKVKIYKDRREQRRDLLEQIIDLDRENQIIREKIEELRVVLGLNQ